MRTVGGSWWPLFAATVTTASLLYVLAALDAAAASRRGAQVSARDLTRNPLREHLVSTGAVTATLRPEVLGESPPVQIGLVAFERAAPGRAAAAPRHGVLPSERLGLAAASAAPDRTLLSIAVDPRDLHDPAIGIMVHPFQRGERWVRGACATLFEGGEAVASSIAGLQVHGGTSRIRPRKSFRLRFAPSFASTEAPSDYLVDAAGDHLVVHSDWRRGRFVNPIGYECLARCGVATPKTKPVRLAINGALQPGVYFLTERLDDSYLRDRHGSLNPQTQRKGNRRSRNYDKVRHILNNVEEDLTVERVQGWFDVDAAERWAAAMLLLAPFDCMQGLEYRTEDDRRWRWVAWDVDWALDDWPVELQQQVLPKNFTTWFAGQTFDIRAAWFEAAMMRPATLRNRMLARIRATVEHHAIPEWWQQTYASYRTMARRMLGDDAVRELELLDRMERWTTGRPDALRRELAERFELGEAHEIRVMVADGSTVTIEGFRYGRSWVGHAFAGEHIALEAGPNDMLVCSDGADAAASALRLVVDGPATFFVGARR